MPFGLSILSRSLRNKTQKEPLTPSSYLLRDSERKTCSSKKKKKKSLLLWPSAVDGRASDGACVPGAPFPHLPLFPRCLARVCPPGVCSLFLSHLQVTCSHLRNPTPVPTSLLLCPKRRINTPHCSLFGSSQAYANSLHSCIKIAMFLLLICRS